MSYELSDEKLYKMQIHIYISFSLYFLTRLPLDKMAAILGNDNFKGIFLSENGKIMICISLKFVPRSPIDNNPALV